MTVVTTNQSLSSESQRLWWKEATIYQIYPASFRDSNGDGLGDIPGVIEKLDYLQSLGVDAVWLCPIFASPQVDMGYDISDYRAIHPPYGTVEDVEKLIAGLHDRNMKLILDLVVNHSSDQHEWFQKSKSSVDSPWRDWYIWRKPRYDAAGNRQPPNNWAAAFGGSAWSYDETTDEYYLHLFAPQQPDLNWDNPSVVSEVHEIMDFWLKKGADGFRMDVINFISKEPGLPDAPVTRPEQPYQDATALFCNGPRLHEHLRGLRTLLDKYNAFSVGEMPGVKDDDQVGKIVASDRKELHTIFQFDIVDMDIGSGGKFSRHDWTLPDFKAIINRWQTFARRVGGWNAMFLENHDQARSVFRFTRHRPEHRELAAKMLATLLCTLGGTLFVYQGQELGMGSLPKTWGIEEYKDIETQNAYREAIERLAGDEKGIQELWTEIHLKARDHARSPVQWTASDNAGFSTGTPWMRVNDDYTRWNAKVEESNANSVLHHWRAGLKIRKQHRDLLVYGAFEMHDPENLSVLSYTRTADKGGDQALVVLNFTDEPCNWTVPAEKRSLLVEENVILSTYGTRGSSGFSLGSDGQLALRPFEALAFVGA
ncbi:Alpha-glucosidase like protein [Verticillium longisporum]|uniref:Alpha-glucosidase like protein n=1 Tax=Verticillium longisporum TaxID=100787 RepID=A0A8I2ZUG3_VERLO|nr:Alpha-glucosidase like protein [Verticillium longisporum]